jgi:hypothetical protein
VFATGLHHQHIAGTGIVGRAHDVTGAGGEQADPDAMLVRPAPGPDAEIETGGIDRQVTDHGVCDLAFDLATLELNDVAARAGNDFLEFLEAFDLLAAERRELFHCACLVSAAAKLFAL